MVFLNINKILNSQLFCLYNILDRIEKILTNNLDENLGLLNKDGSYSYYTVESFPYFISKMKGKVITSGSAPENQIIPQAQSKGIRQALTPLKGAEITKFLTTSENSYQLINKLNII